jgi:DNA-binding YbaB/EbfC family protein
MKGMPGGLQQFIKQANQLQSKAQKLQEELATREFEASSGGNAVKVTVTGDSRIAKLEVSEEVFKSGDREMLQDLVMTAVNEAIKTAKKTNEEEMNKLTGGMSLPGLF